jgi:hypothetical protein
LSGPLSHVTVQVGPDSVKKNTEYSRTLPGVPRMSDPLSSSFSDLVSNGAACRRQVVRRRETANSRGGGIRRRNHIAALSVESCGILQAERWGLWGGSGAGARVPGLPGSRTLAVNFVWCRWGVILLGYGILLCLRFSPPDLRRWCKKPLFKPTRIT